MLCFAAVVDAVGIGLGAAVGDPHHAEFGGAATGF